MINVIKNLFKKFNQDERGNILLITTVFGVVGFALVVGALSSYSVSEHRASVYKHKRELSFQIAEAGINYYRWHLAHDKEDYHDGQGDTSTGPYLHEYNDKDGTLIGYFELDITPPSTGSTVVTIESTGWHKDYEETKRKIRARVGFPSLTDYAFLTNVDVWIGDNEETHGKFHANGGIRFDGTGDAPITSAVETYICKYHHGCGWQEKPGIWGDGTPQDLWEFPIPAKDFSAVIVSLAEIKTGAQNGGLYLSSSGRQGWHLTFQADGTISVRKVSSSRCYKGKDIGSNKYNWYCIDIRNQYSATTYDVPENGYIYVEDTVWVDGVMNGRATVGTKSGKSIIIHDDITYLAKDGTHVLGLIASEDVLIPHNSPEDLEINAALLAQNGACKRYYYPGDTKDQITIYGSVITAELWTWSWVSGGGSVVSGYEHTNSIYDVNLTYNPPPNFPVGSEYNLITWEEIKAN